MMTFRGRLARHRLMVSCAFGLSALFILAGCQSLPKNQSAQCLNPGPGQGDDFMLSGKLALSDGTEGGSGRFSWHQQGSLVKAQFKAPMGQGDWLLEETASGARLVINDEPPYYAPRAETLIAEAVGWPVPWAALKQWIIAQPVDPGQAVIRQHEGTKTLAEMGWTIVYDRFRSDSRGCVPHRIMASKPPHSIRMVIREWQW